MSAAPTAEDFRQLQERVEALERFVRDINPFEHGPDARPNFHRRPTEAPSAAYDRFMQSLAKAAAK